MVNFLDQDVDARETFSKTSLVKSTGFPWDFLSTKSSWDLRLKSDQLANNNPTTLRKVASVFSAFYLKGSWKGSTFGGRFLPKGQGHS